MRGLIVFDLDGTLLCSHHHIVQGLQDTMRELGLPVAGEEKIRALIGEPSADFCRKLASGYDDMDGFITLFRKKERAVLARSSRLYDGVEGLLKTLHDTGYQLVICSNASLEYVELALKTSGIRSLFHSLVSAVEYPSKGQALREIVKASPCENIIMVGDTVHDFGAAAENRIPFIFVGYGYGTADEIRGDCLRAETPEGILALVNQITVYAQIAAHVRRLPGACCIGVNGVDTSGKSVFACRFAEYLQETGTDAAVVHLDDFHNPKVLRQQGKNEIDAYIRNAFNLNTLVSELLLPLRQHGEVHKELTLLDLDTDTYTLKRRFDIGKDTLLILEGILLYREPLTELIDYKIFLDIGFGEVLRRATVRDVPKYGAQMLELYKTKYIPIQQWYLKEHRPKETSNCVVDNTDVASPMIVSLDERPSVSIASTGHLLQM